MISHKVPTYKPNITMSILIKHAKIIVLCSLFIVPSYAQSKKPRVYIDSQGNRYTSMQFDSLVSSQIGRPVAQRSKIEKEDETQIMFDIMTSNPHEEFKQKWVGKALPPFNLKDTDGKIHDNVSLRNKLMVINFWSTTCAPCLTEMPLLSDLKEKYSSKDVIFLAPAPESTEKVHKTIAQRRFTYTILPDAQALFTATGIKSYPYHFIVNENGIIKDIYSGSLRNFQTNESVIDIRLVKAIDELLGK